MAKEIWLLRHAETEWSRNGRHTGRTDLPLLPTGEEHARLLRPQVAVHAFALVLTSPLQRAVRTCELAGLLERAERDPDLEEWDYGDYEGLTTSQIRTGVPNWTIWDHPVPGGETAEDVAARARRILDRAMSVEGDVALFSHGHFLRVLTSTWLRLGPDRGRSFGLDTGTICILGFERENRIIRVWNEPPHLVVARHERSR